MKKINVIGGGLAGCECAYQLAKRGFMVDLYEMKKINKTPAQSSDNLAEIVCSNSFKSNLVTNACGLLKEELRSLDSLLINIADESSIPSGQALSVDREVFSKKVSDYIYSNENINVIEKQIDSLDELDGTIVIATGPLTQDSLYEDIQKVLGDKGLYFYDASAPIVEKESIDFNVAFYGNRYEQERGKKESFQQWHDRIDQYPEIPEQMAYINCPMNLKQYNKFVRALENAEVVELHEFETDEVFEGCMPVEVMAKRGINTLGHGPLKPVGFMSPKDALRPYAVVQLRQDNVRGDLYNMVGFQTNLKFEEQAKIFRRIPGMASARFVKYGVMHRNTYINSSKFLTSNYKLKVDNIETDEGKEKVKDKKIYFAGQISGVEGYVESIMSGLVTGIAIAREEKGLDEFVFDDVSMIGAIGKYISSPNLRFDPMNANFGIIRPLEEKFKKKSDKNENYAKRSLEYIDSIKEELMD